MAYTDHEAGITLGQVVRSNLAGTAAPAVTDDLDSGYGPGSVWIDVTNDNAYTCLDGTVGAAVWEQIDQLSATVTINALDDLAAPATGDLLIVEDITDATNKKADVASVVNLADHDSLTNFVANEHIDHTSVTLSAGTGLTGGGDISANRSFAVDINGAGDLALPATDDELLIADQSVSYQVKKADVASIVNLADHDALTNFDANEHVDHTAVSIIAGNLLTGGGTIAASRTLNVDEASIDHDALTNFVADEHVAHSGVSIIAGTLLTGGGTIDANVTLNVDESSIDHNALTNYQSTEHVSHTGVTLTAGTGLTGGGDISISRSFALDINGLTADASPDGAADYVATYDADAATHKKVLLSDLASAGGDVSKVGTPVDSQVGVWTGDGTIEGDADLTFDTSSNTLALAGAAGTSILAVGGANIVVDSPRGTATLSNIDALDATTETTIEGAIDTLSNLTSIQGVTVTLADAGANAIFGWDDTAGAYENLTQAEARTVLGLGTAAYVATDLADLNEATIEGAIDTLANLTTATSLGTVSTALTGVLRADSGVLSADTDVTDIVSAASDSAAGKVELATIAETTTGTDTGRALTPDGLAGSTFGIKFINVQFNADGTALSTGDGKAYFTIPDVFAGWNIISVDTMVSTVSSSGLPSFQLHNLTQAADVLSVNSTIDVSERTSYTATTAETVNASEDDITAGDVYRVDCDAAGTGTQGGTMIVGIQAP